jgi:hypothetical protein
LAVTVLETLAFFRKLCIRNIPLTNNIFDSLTAVYKIIYMKCWMLSKSMKIKDKVNSILNATFVFSLAGKFIFI